MCNYSANSDFEGKCKAPNCPLTGVTSSLHVMDSCPWHLGVLAGHPKDEGDEEGGQYCADGCSPTHHGQQAEQGHQDDIPLVLNL